MYLLSSSNIMPGSTSTQFSSGLKFITLFIYIEKSIIKPSPTVCPPKLVPPPLGVIDISFSYAYDIICCKSSFDLGKATPIGII